MKPILNIALISVALGLAYPASTFAATKKEPSAKTLCVKQAREKKLKGTARKDFLKSCEQQAEAPAANTATPAAPATHEKTKSEPHTKSKEHKTTRAASTGGNPGAKVWVNKESKVYHCPGDRYYGKTKQGEYMAQSAAQAAGDHAANGKVCQ